jgi:hypothetical protein
MRAIGKFAGGAAQGLKVGADMARANAAESRMAEHSKAQIQSYKDLGAMAQKYYGTSPAEAGASASSPPPVTEKDPAFAPPPAPAPPQSFGDATPLDAAAPVTTTQSMFGPQAGPPGLGSSMLTTPQATPAIAGMAAPMPVRTIGPPSQFAAATPYFLQDRTQQ